MLNITKRLRNANQNNNDVDVSPHTSQKWLSSKKLQTVNAGEGEEEKEPSCTVDGNVNWYSHCGEEYGGSLKTTIWPSNPTPGHQFSSLQSLSHVQLFVTPWTAAPQASLSITNYQSLLKLMSIESVMLSNHLILCHLLLLLPSIFPSIRVFSNGSVLRIRWPKYWSFSIIPSKEYSGLISFRINWFDLIAVQGTLGSLLQHHNSKASIFGHSAFFMIQLSHTYMTTGKAIALIIWTFFWQSDLPDF